MALQDPTTELNTGIVPPHGTPTPSETPTAAAPPTPPAAKEPLYKGMTGHINSAEDLVKYTANIEEQLIAARVAQAPKAPALGPQVIPMAPIPKLPGEDIDDLWYSNPGKARELMRQEFLAEVDKKETLKENRLKFWDEFYTENTDLKGLERIVQSVVATKWSELETMPVAEAKKVLAKETRDMVGLVKKGLGVVETQVPSGSATVLGSSGEPIPTRSAPPAEPMNFAMQVRKLNRRK